MPQNGWRVKPPEFSREMVEVLDSARCEICGVNADAVPVELWEQWTRQHLAMHEPGAAVVTWTYRKALIWRLEP